jgi:NAD(P)-dependent dehydrogenase (short-subunit alcohol dehydrogenase family)
MARTTLIEQNQGGSIVITSSTQGLNGRGETGPGTGDGYVASQHGVVGLIGSYRTGWPRPTSGSNSVHPTGVNTPMVINDAMRGFLNSEPEIGHILSNLMPVPMVEARDISNAIAWLVSDEAR